MLLFLVCNDFLKGHWAHQGRCLSYGNTISCGSQPWGLQHCAFYTIGGEFIVPENPNAMRLEPRFDIESVIGSSDEISDGEISKGGLTYIFLSLGRRI